MKLIAGCLTILLLGACTLGGSSEETAYPKHYNRTKACLDALDAAQALIEGPTVAPPDPLAIRKLMDQAFTAGLQNDYIAWLHVQHQVKATILQTQRDNTAANEPLIQKFDHASASCKTP